MTKKKDEVEACGYCCVLIVILAIIGMVITFWYISLPIFLVGCSIYLFVRKGRKTNYLKKKEAYLKMCSELNKKSLSDYRAKWGERLHPDTWYKHNCPYCQMELVNSDSCEYCGWNIVVWIEKEKRSRSIPKTVQREVWRRDEGRCVECGSKERLEYDHIIPFSKGGSNTVRNIQLLCESCNRKKHNNI